MCQPLELKHARASEDLNFDEWVIGALKALFELNDLCGDLLFYSPSRSFQIPGRDLLSLSAGLCDLGLGGGQHLCQGVRGNSRRYC